MANQDNIAIIEYLEKTLESASDSKTWIPHAANSQGYFNIIHSQSGKYLTCSGDIVTSEIELALCSHRCLQEH